MKTVVLSLALSICVFSASTANSAIAIFDIDDDPGAWATAIITEGLTPFDSYDFDLDSSYGPGTVLAKPLTSAANPPVSMGILPAGMEMDVIPNGFGAEALKALDVGGTNAVVADDFDTDGFSIKLGGLRRAFEFFVALSAPDPDLLVTVFHEGGGPTSFTIMVPPTGHVGFIATAGMEISAVHLLDIVSGIGVTPGPGAEGVLGAGVTYVEESSMMSPIPEPSSIAVFGMLGVMGLAVGALRRRRQQVRHVH